MNKLILSLLVLALTLSACNQTKESSTATQESEEVQPGIISQNYAVVWDWESTNEKRVRALTPIISKEIKDLGVNAVLENAYFGTKEGDPEETFPSIAFFIKAKDMKTAEMQLNNLTLVKDDLATYTLYPVGTLWLKRKDDVIAQRGVTKSFVSVWRTRDKTPSDSLMQAQTDAILALYNNGDIENVYLDLNPEHKANAKTDFVFFINRNTMEQADSLCLSLPFYQQGIAAYDIKEVGVYWLAKSKE